MPRRIASGLGTWSPKAAGHRPDVFGQATPDIPARAVPLRLRERRGGCAHGGILHPWTAYGKEEPYVLKSAQRAAQRHKIRYGQFVISVSHIREASEDEVRRLIEKA